MSSGRSRVWIGAGIVALAAALFLHLPARGADALREPFRRPTTIPAPPENPLTDAKVILGKTLFFDPLLSGSGTVSCATCHSPLIGWTDRVAKPLNDVGVPMERRTPPTVNLAFGDTFLWDGRSENLDTQATGPMSNPGIMNLPPGEMVRRLGAIAGYRALFAAAFPGEAISPATMARAIAAFERSVVSAPAPFDAWVAGDEGAIPEGAKRGFGLFIGKAACVKCHEGWNFTGGSFHDIGLLDTSDPGRARQVPGVVKLQHAFKTPTLRDVAIRPPYMHDGSLKTLAQVIDFYDTGGVVRPSKAGDVRPLGLSAGEKRDLVDFLLTLTGRPEPFVAPVLPR